MAKHEESVEVYANPEVLANTFRCAGPNVGFWPANRGDEVGMQLKYITRDSTSKQVDDRTTTALQGCFYYKSGICSKDTNKSDGSTIPCLVASVVSIQDFNQRIEALRNLKIISNNRI